MRFQPLVILATVTLSAILVGLAGAFLAIPGFVTIACVALTGLGQTSCAR